MFVSKVLYSQKNRNKRSVIVQKSGFEKRIKENRLKAQ
jgi:hypothetical protein